MGGWGAEGEEQNSKNYKEKDDLKPSHLLTVRLLWCKGQELVFFLVVCSLIWDYVALFCSWFDRLMRGQNRGSKSLVFVSDIGENNFLNLFEWE